MYFLCWIWGVFARAVDFFSLTGLSILNGHFFSLGFIVAVFWNHPVVFFCYFYKFLLPNFAAAAILKFSHLFLLPFIVGARKKEKEEEKGKSRR